MAQMKMNTVVQDVEIRIVQRRDGSGDMTLYDIVAEDGSKWTAFEKPLAEKAWDLVGQPVIMDVTVEQKGNYTNQNIRSIAATNGHAPSAAPKSFGDTVPEKRSFGDTLATPTSAAPAPAKAFAPSQAGTTPTPKDHDIWRQVATKVAARLSPDSETDFWANVEALVQFYSTGKKPNIIGSLIESGQVTVGAPPVTTTNPNTFPEEPPPYVDDDIPFS